METLCPEPPDFLNPTGLADLLGQQAAARGQACALRYEDEIWAYADLQSASLRLAGALSALGLRQGARVAYLGYAQPLQIALLFACAQLGAVLVPLNFRLAAPEWAGVLADCTPQLLLSDSAWEEAAGQLAQNCNIKNYEINSILRPYDGDIGSIFLKNALLEPVLLVYTSGTTGKPKGALHTQANLLANMRIASQVQGITPSDLVLTTLPLFHVGGLCIQTLPALFAGAAVLLHARFEAAATLRAISQQGPSLTLQVPATLKALIEHPDWPSCDLSSLRALWVGSSVVPRHLMAAFEQRGTPVCNVYGSTETGPFSIAVPPARAHEPQMAAAGACGWPAPGVALRLDGARQEGDCEVGQLCLRAPNVVAQYWPNTPALDAEGFFHTGDLARRMPDGSICIIGRVKDMVISGGENIYPAELELLLSAQPEVADCAVLGLPDAQWGEVLVAVIVPRDPGADTQALQLQLHSLLSAKIARYKLPRRWVWVDALPKTALGKVQKSLLASTLLLS